MIPCIHRAQGGRLALPPILLLLLFLILVSALSSNRAISATGVAPAQDICAPAEGALDVVFLIDETGSMSGVISTLQDEVNDIAQQLRNRVPDTAFGLATFADYPFPDRIDYGEEDSVPYTLRQDMTTDLEAFQTNVDDLSTSTGGDIPEAYARALYEMVDLGWRDGSQRVVVLIGDTEPHTTDTALGDGLTDPGRDGMVGTSDDIDFATAVTRTRDNDITTVGILAETFSNTDNTETAFAFATNGTYERIPGNPQNVLPTILRLVNAAVCEAPDSRVIQTIYLPLVNR